MAIPRFRRFLDLHGVVVQPLDLHVVNVGSIPTGPTHCEGRLQPHPGDVLKSTPNVRKSPRSGLNLEGRLSDPQICWQAGGCLLTRGVIWSESFVSLNTKPFL